MGIKIIATNRKAHHEYFILETIECGIALTGTEIKSIRAQKVNINDSYCQIKRGECYLINANISKFKEGNINNHDEKRDRKLLLHKQEITKWYNRLRLESALTLVPLKMYLTNGLCKVEVALCKGKKLYDKRESLKEKDLEMREKKSSSYTHLS